MPRSGGIYGDRLMDVVHPPLTGCNGASECSEACHYRQLAERRPDHAANFRRLLRMAAGFGGAVVKHALAGLPLVSAEVKAERLATCEGCEKFDQHNPKFRTCSVCGCSMDVKAGWAEQKCPLGKWKR